jgi:iron complex transport system permease protein
VVEKTRLSVRSYYQMSINVDDAQRPAKNTDYLLLCAALFLCVGVLLSLLCGVTFYSPHEVFTNLEVRSIVISLRLPRTLCAVLVGASLSVVGATYQAIFRNYLASPFTLGVSSGAALLASVSLLFGFSSSRYSLDIGVFALIGALASIFIITLLHRINRHGDSNSLLLIGIVFSFFCSSVMTLLQYLADYSQLFQVTRWLMGGIPTATWSDLGLGALAFGVVFVWALRNARGLDLMLFGDDFASVKGVDVAQLTQTAFICTSIVVGWVVAQCGVVGFVGIIVPALARLMVGVTHFRLIILSALLGALLVLMCDITGRVLISPFEIPAGVFTAVIGGPAFVWLMVKSRQRMAL